MQLLQRNKSKEIVIYENETKHITNLMFYRGKLKEKEEWEDHECLTLQI